MIESVYFISYAKNPTLISDIDLFSDVSGRIMAANWWLFA